MDSKIDDAEKVLLAALHKLEYVDLPYGAVPL
jgi:hypothetical protein